MVQIQEQGKIDNSIEAWKKMLEVHGVEETTIFLSTFQDEVEKTIQIIKNLDVRKKLKRQMLSNLWNHDNSLNIVHSENTLETHPDFKSIKELLISTDAYNTMLKMYGPSETLSFLSTCNYNDQSIRFLTANLRLPKSTDRVIAAENIIDMYKLELTSDFTSSQNLVKTMQFLNTMNDVQGPSETLSFLSTCNYSDQSIKFLVASLSLPESLDRVNLAENIIKKNQKELSWDFKTNEALVRTINKWNMEIKINGPQRVLESLSKKSYRPKCIKFIMANLQLPKTMNRSTETEKIIEANKKNILLKFRGNITNLAEKRLDSHTLNRFIDTFELSKNEAKTLKQEAILATQKVIEHDVKSYLDEIKWTAKQIKLENAEKQVKGYIKELQSNPNEIEAYLDKIHFKELTEKAKTGSSHQSLSSKSKNKNISEYTK